tara:strand:- start:978 stop:5051 length:4074 start_codon:yes stop_codon:yes gene_type:complete
MATMKNLFTYPSNGSEPIKFINPTYVAGTINATDIVSGDKCVIKTVGTTDYTTVGSSNNNVGQSFTASGTPTGSGTVYLADTGLHGRFKDLKDNNLFNWPISYGGNTSPQLLLENSSKFVNYFDSLTGANAELNMRTFYDNPLVVATKKLIDSETITAANVDTTSALVTVSGAHEFENGMKVTISGMNGTWADIDNADYFASDVSNASNGTLKLKVGSSSGPYVRFYDLKNASISSSNLLDPFTLTFSSHPFNNGDLVDLSNFNNDYTIHNGQSYYVQNKTSTTLQLSTDSGGSNLLGFNQTGTLAVPSLQYRWGTTGDTSAKWIVDLTGFQTTTGNNNQTITFTNTGQNKKLGPAGGTYNLIPTGISDNLFYISTDATIGNSKTLQNILNEDIVGAPTLAGTGTSLGIYGRPDHMESTDTFMPIIGLKSLGSNSNRLGFTGPGFLNTGSMQTFRADFSILGQKIIDANKVYYVFGYDLFTDHGLTNKVDLSNFGFTRVKHIDKENFDLTKFRLPVTLDGSSTDILRTNGYYGMVTYSGNAFNSGYYMAVNADGSLDDFYGDGVHSRQTVTTLSGAYQSNSILRGDAFNGNIPTPGTHESGSFSFLLDSDGTNFLDGWKIYAYTSDGSGGYNKSPFATWIEGKTTKELNQPLICATITGGSGSDIDQRFLFVHQFVYTGDISFGGGTVPNGYYEVFQYTDTGTGGAGSDVPNSPYYNTVGLNGWNFQDDTVFSAGYYSTPDYTVESVALDITDNVWFDQTPTTDVPSGKTVLLVPKFLKHTFGQHKNGTWDTNAGNSNAVGPVLSGAPSGTTLNPVFQKIKPGVIVNYNGTDYLAIRNREAVAGQFHYYNSSTSSWTNDGASGDFESIWLYALTDKATTWTPSSATAYPGDVGARFHPAYPFTQDGNETLQSSWDFSSKYENHWTEHLPTSLSETTFADKHATVDTGTYLNISNHIGFAPFHYQYDNTMSVTVANATSAATTGDLVENFTPADAGQIARTTLTAATTGSIAPATSEPYRYEIDTVTMYLPGTQKYTFQNTSNVTTAGGQVKTTEYWGAGDGSVSTYSSTGETAAQFTVATDSSGYLTGVTLTEEVDAEGRYADGDDIALIIESKADTYAPRATTTAESEDVFDTQDYWVDPTFNTNKEWPRTVTPASAKIIQNHPSTTNISQDGTKFTRSAGFTKWQLEVTYPPMTPQQFAEFQGVANAVQGQNLPFMFINRNSDGNPIIFDANYTNTGSDTTLELVKKNAVGDSVVRIGGFDSNQTKAFNRGEIVIFASNNNGSYNVVVHDADANEYGETRVRLAYPLTVAQNSGSQLFKNPFSVAVTLGEDNFEYQISTDNYYYLTVKFDLDEFN